MTVGNKRAQAVMLHNCTTSTHIHLDIKPKLPMDALAFRLHTISSVMRHPDFLTYQTSCVRECERACVRACVRAGMRGCVRETHPLPQGTCFLPALGWRLALEPAGNTHISTYDILISTTHPRLHVMPAAIQACTVHVNARSIVSFPFCMSCLCR